MEEDPAVLHGGLAVVQSPSSRGENESGAPERWNAAVTNLTEIGNLIESLQSLLLKKAIYADEEVFTQAAAITHQARTVTAQERRIRALEREVDASVSAARYAQVEKKKAEAAQHSAEAHAQEVLKELENTTQVFKLHMEELRSKQQELAKKDAEIKVLQAIIDTISTNASQSKKQK